ncbi:hypothetical protein NEOLEDRAFT_1151504 [Neolentinus lepideus HHB14362 ss-1]|uniref:F-box domain-containing protein n=1 Tax=Neolentinus lepideus HHB14362 ss-1 TaxID=1314782 RepID=A0A165NWL9_9AGAM|nr:hypothetical protein NEOLEDRAFT_1151504 [Neolentinus lepideus HHB14362 ss-1]
MNQLPVEAWQVIFGYACTDDGTTARSLSVACRYFREASKSVRFQSLKLLGMHQLRAFSAITAQETDVRVRFLFISDARPTPPGEPQDADVQPVLRDRLPGEQVQERDTFIRAILESAAPTLEVLFLGLRSGRSYLLTPVCLPALRELSVYGTYSYATDTITPGLHPFTKLKRLHFNGSYDLLSQGTDLTLALAEVNRLAPSLTHLGCTNGNIIQVQQIASALGIGDFFPSPQSMPRTVTHIYFTSRYMYVRSARSLRTLIVREVPRKQNSDDDALENWLAVTRGRERFWASAININCRAPVDPCHSLPFNIPYWPIERDLLNNAAQQWPALAQVHDYEPPGRTSDAAAYFTFNGSTSARTPMIPSLTSTLFLSTASLTEAQEQTLSSASTNKWPVGAWVGLAVGLTVLCALVAIVVARVDYYCCFSRPEYPRPSDDSDWRPPYPSPPPAFVQGLVVPSHGSSGSSDGPPGYLEAGYRSSYLERGDGNRGSQSRRGLNYDYYHPPPGLNDDNSDVASPKKAHVKVRSTARFIR